MGEDTEFKLLVVGPNHQTAFPDLDLFAFFQSIYYNTAPILSSEMFRHSICEPLNPHIIEKGIIDERDIISTFQAFPWKDYLQQMEDARDSDIQYSPSLEFENQSAGIGLVASAVGSPDDFVFYLFFKRSKSRKKLFGLINRADHEVIDDLTGQSEEDVIRCLQALKMEDLDYLEQKFGA